jgi:AcrR family transcriptional regulator
VAEPAPARRRYASPLRAARARATRERILDAALALIEAVGLEGLSLAAVAARAGLPERTLYRHWAGREALLDALWQRIAERVGMPEAPTDPAGWADLPRTTFAGFDRHAALMRALLASPSGRAFARRDLEARTAALERALAPVTAGLAPEDRAALVALVQLLNTATAWATLVAYRGIDGPTAGRIAARGLDWLFSGSRRRSA